MPNPDRNFPGVGTGIATILATVFAMALTDAFVKHASADMTLWQIYVLRSSFVVPVLLVLSRGRFQLERSGWIMIRSLALALMYLGIYTAIPLLDLSVIAASLYTGPLFIVALTAVFLREPVTARHWMAIATGFAGVLLIVRPAASDFTPLSLIPVSAALLYAIAAVLTRAKCAATPALTLALWLNLTLFAFGGLASLLIVWTGGGADAGYRFLFGDWSPMSGSDWRQIGVLALLMIAVSIGLAKAYKSPHPQVIATFDYAYLPFAAFWGFVFFGEIPDLTTAAGMTLIALAGVIVLRAGRKATAVTPPRPGRR